MLCHSIVYCTLLKIGLICLLAHVVRLDESMCSNLPAAYNQNGLEIAIPEKQFKGSMFFCFCIFNHCDEIICDVVYHKVPFTDSFYILCLIV